MRPKAKADNDDDEGQDESIDEEGIDEGKGSK